MGASAVQGKRPMGLMIISILWGLGAIYNIIISLYGISVYLPVLPFLSDPLVLEWFKFGVPVALAINVLVFVLGIIQLFTIYGLLKGKSWSYYLALAIPILASGTSISTIILYMSAPAGLGIRESIDFVSALPAVLSIAFIVIYWIYLRKPHVKEYLRVTPIPTTPTPLTPPPPPPTPPSPPATADPLEMLKMRYARGEISKEEYEEIYSLVAEPSAPTAALNKCPFCEFEVQPSDTFCPNCGRRVKG